jgi:hypothetical protein
METMTNGKKHEWLKVTSKRTQPYTLDDITVIIPSAHGRYEKRWKWFWPQYVAKTEPLVVKNTIVPCDKKEVEFLKSITVPEEQLLVVEPRWIVCKTLNALFTIKTRLTFRLANDIMVVRRGWEQLLLDQFNAVDKLQIIGELQQGVSFPETHEALSEWDFFKREYEKTTTAAQYIHGARVMAQSAVWRAYYSLVPRYTFHDHDEIFFCQLARGDGIVFTNFRGSNLYLAHVGITNKDFGAEYIEGHVEPRRRELASAPDKHDFVLVP